MSTENVPEQTPRPSRFLPFLLDHWKRLLGALLILALAASFCFARGAWRGFKIRRAQSIFASLPADPAALAAFSEKHRSMTLGALASFAVGNYSAISEDFSSAATAYGRGGPLKAAKLDGVASVAQAVCSLRCGDVQSAEKTLLAVANDCRQPNSVRAAAHYFRALSAWKNGQRAAAAMALDAMNQLQDSGQWAGRALLLSMAIK